jgi:hypothetical protein
MESVVVGHGCVAVKHNKKGPSILALGPLVKRRFAGLRRQVT